MDDAGQVWHAGHVNDVLEIDHDTIVVAADRGGVWRLSSLGNGTGLSDTWNNPDLLSLAFGAAGHQHIFAACGEYNGKGALWVTDPTAPDPFSAWHKIPVPDPARGVIRVLVLPGVARIAFAAQRGLWYSPFPSAATPFAYQWTQVTAGLPNLAGDIWTEIAEVPGQGIVAALPGDGFFYGGWVAGVLQMQRAALPADVNAVRLGRTSLASCASDRRFIYAVSADAASADPPIFALLFSSDGGVTWQSLNTQVIGQPPGTTVAAIAGNQGGYNNCIAVSPQDAAVVALGWRTGPFISQDFGRNWQMYSDNVVELHGDVHAVYFSPDGRRLYVGTDGGVVRADIVPGPPNQPYLQNFTSIYNRRLATLQFGGWPTHEVWATIGANDQFAAGGLQDNGNVYCRWKHGSPWRAAGDSDGQLTLLTTATDLLFDNSSDHTHPSHTSWDGARMVESGVVPLRNPDGDFDGNGVTGLGSPRELYVEVVPAPALPSQYSPNFCILAVAGVGNNVYGLFPDDREGIHQHWEPIGSIPLDPADFITAVGSYDGLAIFAGSNRGFIFRLNPVDRSVADMSPANVGTITRILVDVSTPPVMRGFGRADNVIIELDHGSARWNVLGPVTPVPAETVFDVAVDWRAQPPRLFAITDTRVFMSQDGRNWNDVSQGLPETPHCAGLRVAAGRLFVSTFGRSMWCASLMESWSDEEDLSGVLTSAPAACTWGPGRVDAFYRGQNNHLWHRWFEGDWHNEEDLGGVLSSAPAACTWGPGRVDAFYRGQNNHLWHRWFEGDWHNEEDLGGVLSESPAACTWAPQRIDAFYRGQNLDLWHSWYPV
jgi:hypothetical protein